MYSPTESGVQLEHVPPQYYEAPDGGGGGPVPREQDALMAAYNVLPDTEGGHYLTDDQYRALTDRAREADSLEQRLFYDYLTGALSRHGVPGAIETLKPLGKRIIIIVSDLENFKAFNDTQGHGVGDEVLQFTVDTKRDQEHYRQINGAMRKHESIHVRPGGDEIISLVVVDDEEDAEAVASAIVNRVDHVYDNDPRSVDFNKGKETEDQTRILSGTGVYDRDIHGPLTVELFWELCSQFDPKPERARRRREAAIAATATQNQLQLELLALSETASADSADQPTPHRRATDLSD